MWFVVPQKCNWDTEIWDFACWQSAGDCSFYFLFHTRGFQLSVRQNLQDFTLILSVYGSDCLIMQTLSPLSADIFSVTPNGLSLPLRKCHFFILDGRELLSSIHENFHRDKKIVASRWKNCCIAMKKNTSFQHYTNIRRFCEFFVKISPPPKKSCGYKNVFLSLR